MKILDSRSLWLLGLLVACCGGASKYYSGENKPYEFGFKIEGEQHRHEKKDENGLIMGEFGFITADGVYHVTVYATDENGNFKIISMKNIRVHPYPGTKTADTNPAQRRPIPLSAPENPILPRAQGPSSPAFSAAPPPPIAAPAKSCSHCSLPTTTTRRPVYVESNINSLGPDYTPAKQNPLDNAGPHVLPLNAPENFSPHGNPANGISIGQNSAVNNPSDYEAFPPYGNDQNPFVNQQSPNTGFRPVNNNNIDHLIKQHEGVINNYNSQHSPDKPTLLTADVQRVSDQANIHASAPGEREGLINGLDNGDMLELLYTFNYTVGFHAHHEKGYRNGEKKGYYYVTGRDGVRLRVDYVADSTGYHPRISQEAFALDAPEVPKPETETKAEFGLKGYEFKWLYFPPSEQSGR